MDEKQLAEILSTLNEKDRTATDALTRANVLHTSGRYDDAQEAYTESVQNMAYRDGIIDTLAILGYVAGIARNTGKWVIIRKQ